METEIIHSIALNDVEVAEENVRKSHADEAIQELADSIKIHGQMQPIVLKGDENSPKPYKIIVGQRRYLAHMLLGKESIKAVFSGVNDATNALLYSLAENMQRTEPKYTDTAKAITALYVHFDRDEYKVKEALGLNVRTIRDYINIEEFSTEKGKKYLEEGKITKADLKRVIQAANGDKQKIDELVEIISSLSKYEKNRAVGFGQENPSASTDEIVEEAKKPKLEETVILNLSMEITEAVRIASEDLSVDLETLSMTVLTEWLKENEYLK